MAFDSQLKPSPKPVSSSELEATRKPPSRSLSPTKGPDRGIPRYLRGELERGATSLPSPLAERFSRAYGHDLSGVRVHLDSPLPDALGARALTMGQDIAFARGAWQPGSTEGQQLLGHELAHVVQQAGGRMGVQAKGLSSEGSERQADDAAQAALAGEPVGELSPLAAPGMQLKAVNASPSAGRGQTGRGPGAQGVLDLSRGLLDIRQLTLAASGRVCARLPGVAEGELELEKHGEGYSTSGEGSALRLVMTPLARLFGDTLVLVVRVTHNTISGHVAVGKPGQAVRQGEANFWRTLEKGTEALGWAGLSGLSVNTPKNLLEGGVLKLGAEAARFSLGGVVEGQARFSLERQRVTFDGSAEVKLRGASSGRLAVRDSPGKGLSGEAKLKVDMGMLSGDVDATLRRGALNIQGTAQYTDPQLKGRVTLVATDAATARELLRHPPGAGASPSLAGVKPGPRVLCGWGELDFALTEWLVGRVEAVVNSEGAATVKGQIAPPKEVVLFTQKQWNKRLLRLEARAIFGIPLLGNLFVFANVGLEALASVGPAKLSNIKLGGQYSTDKKADSDLSLQATLNIPAFAGLRLRAEGGAGVELLGADVKFGVGVWALGGVRGYVEAMPTIGYRRKGGKPGEFFIRGHMELAAQPFLELGGDLFVEVDAYFWDKKWTWPLGSLEYPLPGEFGIGADLNYVLGSKQWPEIKFDEVKFDGRKFMMDLLHDEVPKKRKSGERKKRGLWSEGGAGKRKAGSGGGSSPASAPRRKYKPSTTTKLKKGQDKKGQEYASLKQRFQAELARVHPAGRNQVDTALATVARTLPRNGTLKDWSSLKKLLEATDSVKRALDKPLNLDHAFGKAAHEKQALPQLEKALSEGKKLSPVPAGLSQAEKSPSDWLRERKKTLNAAKSPFVESKRALNDEFFVGDQTRVSRANAELLAAFVEVLKNTRQGDEDPRLKEAFRGPKQTLSRLLIIIRGGKVAEVDLALLRALTRDPKAGVANRGYLGRQLRNAMKGNHEWIPVRLLMDMVEKDLEGPVKGNPCYWIKLQYHLRIDTAFVIFKPEKAVRTEGGFAVLQGHPGALYLGDSRTSEQKGSKTFHEQLVKRIEGVMGLNGSIESLIRELKGQCEVWIWTGESPGKRIHPELRYKNDVKVAENKSPVAQDQRNVLEHIHEALDNSVDQTMQDKD